MSKSVNMRVALLPYPVITAAVAGNSEAMAKVVRHYSGYIATLVTRTIFDANNFPHFQIDEDLRRRLETKLMLSILEFDLT